ncbi:MAG: bifunctional riboflavin kinase/FAD synthetase, partial [Candidatus Acidiferrales bacterium]
REAAQGYSALFRWIEFRGEDLMPLIALHSADEWIARMGDARKPTAVTIGNFDGVHLGHQRILRDVSERAQHADLMAGVLTFYPHPARVLRPAQAPSLLITLAQRLEEIAKIGMGAALVQRFDQELAKVSAEDFVRRFLVDTMRAKAVLVGDNFRFGHKQAGDVKMLTDLGRRWGFEVEVVPPVLVDGVVVSSTAIRQAAREGRMEDARKLLGRPFALEGEIRTGTGQGRKLIVPTLNLATEQETLPMNGVYATETMVEGKLFRSATNVGVRPTFDGTRLAIESHLFDFHENLTSGRMEIRFWTRLRDEQKFAGPDALREQVLRDIEKAKEFLSKQKPSVEA